MKYDCVSKIAFQNSVSKISKVRKDIQNALHLYFFDEILVSCCINFIFCKSVDYQTMSSHQHQLRSHQHQQRNQHLQATRYKKSFQKN